MGASTIIAWMGGFIVLMVCFTNLLGLYNEHLSDVQGFYEYEKDVNGRYKTDFDITGVKYLGGSLELDVKNTGRERIIPWDKSGKLCLDLLVDGEWISHDSLATDVMNKTFDPRIWDPDEFLKVTAAKSLAAGNHTVTLVDCDGTKDVAVLSV